MAKRKPSLYEQAMKHAEWQGYELQRLLAKAWLAGYRQGRRIAGKREASRG